MDRTETPELDEIEIETNFECAPGRTKENSHATRYTFRCDGTEFDLFVKTTGSEFVRIEPSQKRSTWKTNRDPSISSLAHLGQSFERNGDIEIARILNTLFMDYFRK